MRIEIDYIKNGWIVENDIGSIISEKRYFKTIYQAISHSKNLLNKYKRLQNG